MTSGHQQEYDLFADRETREQADEARRSIAERVRDCLVNGDSGSIPEVEVARLVRSYTVGFRFPDGSSGMVLIWSNRSLAMTYQMSDSDDKPETNVCHSPEDLLRNIRKLFTARKSPDS
jgi:hypothetical protein